MERIIRIGTNENDLILDSCMGSGSTIIAAINLKRQYIGFELDETYFKIAQKRIDDLTKNLF